MVRVRVRVMVRVRVRYRVPLGIVGVQLEEVTLEHARLPEDLAYGAT